MNERNIVSPGKRWVTPSNDDATDWEPLLHDYPGSPQYSDFYALELQAFDLLHIASGAFFGVSEALVRNSNCMISFIVRCRYRTF